MVSNIIQVALVVILFPFAAILVGAASGSSDSIGDMIISLAGEIPLSDVWLDVLYQYSGGLSADEVLSSTVGVILKAFPEAVIAALCVYVCIRVSKKLNARGLPIFSTFLGILISSFIISLTGRAKSALTEIIAEFGAVILLVVGIKILIRTVLGKSKAFKGISLSLKQLFLFVIDGVFAVITTAYVSGLIMAAGGLYSTVGQAIGRIMILSMIEICVAVGVGVISDLAQNDPDIL